MTPVFRSKLCWQSQMEDLWAARSCSSPFVFLCPFLQVIFFSGHLCWFSHVVFPSHLYSSFIVLFSLSDFLLVQVLWTVFVLYPSSPFFDSFLSLLLTAWTNLHVGFNCSRHTRLSTCFLKVFSFPSSDIRFYMFCFNQYRYYGHSSGFFKEWNTCLLNTV